MSSLMKDIETTLATYLNDFINNISEQYKIDTEELYNLWNGGELKKESKKKPSSPAKKKQKTDSDIEDKELFVIPSNHNDFVKRYLQSGDFIKDSADNVKAIYGIGPKKAEKLLAGKSKEEMRTEVQYQYQQFFGDNWYQKYDS